VRRALSTATVLAAAAALLLLGSSKVFGGSTSLLDPYASVQAPQPKYKQKSKTHKQLGEAEESTKTKAAKHRVQEPEVADEPESDLTPAPVKTPVPKATKSNTLKADKASAYKSEERATAKASSNSAGAVSEKPVSEKHIKEASTGIKSDSAGEGVVSGLKEIQHGYVKTFKAAGGSLLNGTKAATAKLAESSKKMREGVASGTGALAHGLKTTGEKVKAGAGAVGDKVKAGAETVGEKVKSAPDVVATSTKSNKKHAAKIAKKPEATVEEQSQDEAQVPPAPAEKAPDFSTLGKPLEPVEPLKNVKAPHIKNSHSGVVSKAVDKFNIFGKKQHAPSIPPIQPAHNTAVNPSAAQQLNPN